MLPGCYNICHATKLFIYIYKDNVNPILMQNTCVSHSCLAGTYWKSFKRQEYTKKQWITCTWIHVCFCPKVWLHCGRSASSARRVFMQALQSQVCPLHLLFFHRLCRSSVVLLSLGQFAQGDGDIFIRQPVFPPGIISEVQDSAISLDFTVHPLSWTPWSCSDLLWPSCELASSYLTHCGRRWTKSTNIL